KSPSHSVAPPNPNRGILRVAFVHFRPHRLSSSRDQHVLSSHADGAGSAGGPQGRVGPRFSSDASSFTTIELLLHGFTQRSRGRTLALVRNHCLSHLGSEMVALKVVHAGGDIRLTL
ncbi:hypothetical protein PVAP13_3NG151980, partial [Panicum virgatum]